ncbi:MAG TPA: 5-oxoprolinase subunit PxpB [Candidatus Limnocylindrales bacterium]
MVRPFGDAALLIEVEGESALQRAARVHGIADWIADVCSARDGWGRPVPGAETVLVPFDPVEPGLVAAAARIRDVLETMSPGEVEQLWPDQPRIVEVPVRYGGEAGPDLDGVAASLGLPADDVVLLHASRIYRVLFIGFMAGFAYCGTLAAELALPRRASPRTRVDAGSIVIAGRMTSVMPVDAPSGWHVIGHTSLSVWDPRRDPPGRLRPGDAVRFVPEA